MSPPARRDSLERLEKLIAALKAAGFELAIETNGTRAVPEGVDWVCVSPKAGNPIVQRSGDEGDEDTAERLPVDQPGPAGL